MNKETGLKYGCMIAFCLLILSEVLFAQSDTNYYQQSLLELSKIYVSSEKKTNQELSSTSATIRVITSKQIEEKAYFSLEDVLADLPGFQFRNIMGLNSYSFLRGLPRQNNAILILIDGIQINELNSGGFYGGGQYNLSNVEKIEVLYGPSSVIYGSNAISGIINIITKSPDQKNKITANTAMGSFNTFLTDLTYSHAGDNASFQLSGMFKTTEKANLSGKNNDYFWDDDLEIFENDYAIDAKVSHKKIVAGVNYQNRQSSTSTHYPSVNTVHKGYGTLWNLLFINAYLKHSTSLSDKVNLHNTLYNRNATLLSNSVKEVTDTGQIGYCRPNNLIGFESVLEINSHRKLNFIAGFLGYFESLASAYSKSYSEGFSLKPEKPVPPPMTNNGLIGCFIQLQYSFFNYWKFVPGLRYEYSTSYKQVITPRASVLFNSERFSSKLIYARAYRAPKPWDYTSGIGNQDLEPEYFNSLELSNTWFISKNLKTDISLYNNNLRNGIIKQTNLDNSSYYWDNAERILTRGLEASVNYTFRKLNAKLNYSYCHSVDNTDEFIDEIAPHTAMLGLKYCFTKHVNIELNTFYIGRRKNPKRIEATHSMYIEEAVVSNLYFSILHYKNANIQFIIKNLTNTEYYHTSNLTPDRFRQPQMSFFVKLSYKFKKL